MRYKLLSLPIIGMTCAWASAQISTGTIIVFGQSQSRFVIAADSRAAFNNRPPDDTQCKISAFKAEHVVFAASNALGFTNAGQSPLKTWSAFEVAKQVVSEPWSDPAPADATEAANRLAIAWERQIIEHWKQTSQLAPVDFWRLVLGNKNTDSALTVGFFAIAYRGQVAWADSSVIFRNGEYTTEHPHNPCSNGVDLCASGQLDVFNAYFVNHKTKPPNFDQLEFAIHLATLTAEQDLTGTVHGPIDALELLADGTINWKQRKDSCPDNRD